MRYVTSIALAALASTQALAVGRVADVSIIDRDTGQVLQTHYRKGEYWVAGRPGAHYAIQIRSQDGRRLLAVTSVDGVNVLTGETAGVDQRGYVFDPWQHYDIAGWRKSDSQIAAFTFTSVPKSYAAQTGRPANVGVIGVAVFRERPPQLAQHEPPMRMERSSPAAEAPATALSSELAETTVTGERRDADSTGIGLTDKAARARAPAPAPSLGTGHGRREYSRVWEVGFERERTTPDEVVRIRYDSHDNLVAMGVIRRSPPPHRPDAFPDSTRLGYVPDP
jgi:hypothetical protein